MGSGGPDDDHEDAARGLPIGEGAPVADEEMSAADARTGRGPTTRDQLPAVFRVGDAVFSGVLVVMVVLLLGVVGYNVFGRYVLGRSLAWADEAARYLFIWVIFLGGALAHFRREHIAVEFFAQKLPRVGQVGLAIVRELVILFVLGIMLWGSVRVIGTTFGTSALLGVPNNIVNWPVPISASLMAVMSIYRLARVVTVQEV